EEEPANPRVTPQHIKPEWYFLATYQYLKLMEYPRRWFGIDGKMLGVLSQGPAILAIVTLPYWYRRNANRAPSWIYYAVVTLVVAIFLVLTMAAIWPPGPLFLTLSSTAIAAFFILLMRERRAVRQLMGDRRSPEEDVQS